MYLISQVSIIDNIYNENTDTLRIARPTHPQGTIVVFRSESLSWCCRLKLFWFRMWVGWVCVLFLSCREANIPNLSLLLCLEPFQKFLVVGWWGVVGWLRPILVFSLSLSQAEQNQWVLTSVQFNLVFASFHWFSPILTIFTYFHLFSPIFSYFHLLIGLALS